MRNERLQRDFPVLGTLGCPSVAAFGGVAESLEHLLIFRRHSEELGLPIFWLGEGSNIVPHEHIQGAVIQVRILGVERIVTRQHSVVVRVGAGVNWHEFVQFSLTKGWYGLENLALIPGSVGAVPVQNVGAYGVEVDQFIHAVHVQNALGETLVLSNSECEFSYRDSLFKRQPEWVITAVEFELPTQDAPNLSYVELADALAQDNIETSAKAVFDTVVRIRSKKLPTPAEYANVGSFFKNPIVTTQKVSQLRLQFPALKQFAASTGSTQNPEREHGEEGAMVKLSAAQLIDLAGGKLIERSQVHCWPSQPLVLINEEHADANQVLKFAAELQQMVDETFAVTLHIEPQIWS